jgi:elongation factor G
MPIGLEENFEGIIDLIKMKAYYFEGEMGNTVIEKEVPENMKEEARRLSVSK